MKAWMSRWRLLAGAAALLLLIATGCGQKGKGGEAGGEKDKGAGPKAVAQAEGAATNKAAASDKDAPGLANVPWTGAKDPSVVIIEVSDFQ